MRIPAALSDGRPEDHDRHRGQHAIEDTRTALIEARRLGRHPFCVTIDHAGRDYLPRRCGPARFVVVDEVAQLPLMVAGSYRRLATRARPAQRPPAGAAVS